MQCIISLPTFDWYRRDLSYHCLRLIDTDAMYYIIAYVWLIQTRFIVSLPTFNWYRCNVSYHCLRLIDTDTMYRIMPTFNWYRRDVSYHCLRLIYTDAMYRIAKKDGIVSLWSSTLPSVVLASNPAVQFMVYEALKRYFQRYSHQKVWNLPCNTRLHCLISCNLCTNY